MRKVISDTIGTYSLGALVLVLLFAAAYDEIMFDGAITRSATIESFNYSVQTMTTVGYGNWVPTWMDQSDASVQRREERVKGWSILFMLIGGGYFAFGIGVISGLVVTQILYQLGIR